MILNQIDKFTILVSIGILSNIAIGISCIVGGLSLLLIITIFIFVCTLIGYSLYCFSDYKETGIHVMMGSYLVGFSYAITTELITYPLILVYPILISLASVLFKYRFSKIMYLVLCILGTNFYILNQQKSLVLFDTPTDLTNAMIISTGMMIALYYVTYIHESTIQEFQQKLRKNETRLSNKNSELKKYIESNLQLENFAYLASHELKTPMRNISNFTGLLGIKLKNKMNDDEKELISYVKDQVMTMNSLIADLLKLSQTSHNEIIKSNFETGPFISKILQKISTPYRGNIYIEDLPFEIFGSKELLRQLFSNIIQNAIKFKDPNKEFKLIISGRQFPGHIQFEISDQGIGIQDHLKDQIFLIFKRLNHHKGITGTGIGLALCKTIVERHNGKIWVEDNHNGGCIFKFNLAMK